MRKIYQQVMAVVLAVTALLGVALWRKSLSDAPIPKKLVAQNADAGTTGVSEATLSDIRSSLEKQEYHISFDEKKKMLQSPNRAHNLRAYYQPGKFTVQTRVDTTGQGFKLELINEGIFADGKPLYTPQSDAKAEHHENKVQISHEAFTEEFINTQDGVRQNFIVQNAPKGTRQLQVKMAAKGLKVRQGAGNELRFYSETANGQTRNELVYNDLKCWDADKKPLSATLAYLDDRIQITVDVASAAYPVTIDPIVANGTPQNPNKVLEINQSYMWLGFSVSSAGDVNGDGYSDVIVGAPNYDKGQDNEGGAFVYKGDPSGLTLTAVTFESNQANAKMGYSVSSAGDFNGDGFSDVLVGIPYYDKDAIDEGRANLYLGSSTFFNSAITAYGLNNSQGGSLMGISVATAGDINGDGFSDIIIGCPQASIGESKEGTVRYYLGNASGAPKALNTLQINQANAQFGYSLAPAGDVDADGFSDIIVGARWYTNGQGQDAEGAAFIYRGSGNGQLIGPVVIEGNQLNAAMGNKVSSAGDVDGDGYSDVLISAYLFDSGIMKDNGIVNLYLGSSTGISAQQQPARTFYGNDNDHMGSSIACAGDVNGDGYSDILLGAEYHDNGQFNEGAVFVYQGSKDGIIGDPASMLESNQGDGWFGTAVSSAGDVNGDGYSDILIGCYTFDNGQKDEGHVFVYHGGADGVGTNGSVTLTNNKSSSYMGTSVASAGDVNSDGYDDIIVGAPNYDKYGENEGIAFLYYGSPTGINFNDNLSLYSNYANGYFGGSVAGAGDVNGDGYDDVLVGAKEYTIGASHQGVVFLYNGASGGLNPSGLAITVNKADADFGFAVAGAGDVNRDGYADFIVGAPTYSATGTIFVYPGGANGAGNPVPINGTQSNSHFGEAVSSAGDVDGNGYSDIIVGAWGATLGQAGEGAAYIFHGQNGGVSTVASKILEGDQNSARFGASVSSAGDINGDGFSDVIVGAPYFDHGQSYEGVAIVYYGTNTGISTSAPALPTILEANCFNAEFGSSVAGAGDLNGDGYSDVIVGAPKSSNGQIQEGEAFIFHGSLNGAKTTYSFHAEGEQISADLGWSVSGAGDVNGDGYSDILVGVPDYDNGQYTNAGAMKVFYGNNGKGLRNNVRLYNSGLVGPYDHNQFNLQNFGLGLFVKSFIGRNKARLVWETRSNGNAFSKVDPNPITTSTQFSGEGSNLPLLMEGVERTTILNKAGTTTRVRARIRYSPALAITGQMYGPWRYVQRQLAGYNNAPVPEEAMAETIRKKAEPEADALATLFPNPASDRLSIQVADPSDIRAVRLYNASGKPVFQSQRYEKDIDVSKLPGGIYILMLNRANGTPTSHRILIRR
jgi:hypothetical protein